MPFASITRLRVRSWQYLPAFLIQSVRAVRRAKHAAGNVVMSGPSTTPLGPAHRLTVEDAPNEADIEVLPQALEAYNESEWPQHALEAARYLRTRRVTDYRRARWRDLLRVAVRKISLGIRWTARPRDRARLSGSSGRPRPRARLSLGMAGHV
jgi:hypothetical protein